MLQIFPQSINNFLKTIKGRIIIGVIIFIIFVLFRKIISYVDYSKQSAHALLPNVAVIQSQSKTVNPTLSLTGVSQAFKTVTLRAETAGKIVALPIEKGTWVADKQILIQIIDNDRAARLKEAESRFKQREAEFNASKDLRDKALKAENAHLATKADFESAKAILSTIQLEVDHLSIKAPFNGYYDQRSVDIGDFVGIGDPVATILQLDPLTITINIAEMDLQSIFEGQTATVSIAAFEKNYPAKITYISKTAEPTTRTFLAELTLDNPDKIPAGLTCQVNLVKKPVQAHEIPLSSLILNDRGTLGVMGINSANKTHFYAIHVESSQKESVLATGLPQHLTVITTGSAFVKEGQMVNIKEKASHD